MKNNRKALLLLLCAVLMVGASVFGTLAYLTDTEAVTNTFTVGSVGIQLDEADVKPDGTLDTNERVTANDYHLLPGHTYKKDPTIHVDATSEDCYLFVKVENGIAAIETTVAEDTIAKQMETLGWKPVSGVDNVFVFAKEGDKYVIHKDADVEVFKEFTIDGNGVDNTTLAQYADAQIVVTAYAVQKDGFEETAPEEIWKTALASVATPNP